MGWQVGGKITCPACLATKRKRKAPPMKPATATGAATQPTVVTTADVEKLKKNKRLVIQALEDYFDERKKRYRDDWSDAKVAGETGLSEKFVIAVREEFFGSIAANEPENIRHIRTMLKSLLESVHEMRMHIEGIDGAALSIETELEKLSLTNNWRID